MSKAYKLNPWRPTLHAPHATRNTYLVSKAVQGHDGSLGSICHFAQGDIHGETMSIFSVKFYIVFGP